MRRWVSSTRSARSSSAQSSRRRERSERRALRRLGAPVAGGAVGELAGVLLALRCERANGGDLALEVKDRRQRSVGLEAARLLEALVAQVVALQRRRRRSTTNGRITSAYWCCLNASRIVSATPRTNPTA